MGTLNCHAINVAFDRVLLRQQRIIDRAIHTTEKLLAVRMATSTPWTDLFLIRIEAGKEHRPHTARILERMRRAMRR
jgi:hypothetical protein